MAFAAVQFDRQPDASWKPVGMWFATARRLQCRMLPGDSERDWFMTNWLDEARKPTMPDGTLGDWQDWLRQACWRLTNGHTRMLVACQPKLTLDQTYQYEVLGIEPAPLNPPRLRPTEAPPPLSGYKAKPRSRPGVGGAVPVKPTEAYSEDQARDDRGRWEGSGPGGGGKLGTTVDKWIDNSAGMRSGAAGEKGASAAERTQGRMIAEAVAEKGTPAPELYRGMSPMEGEHSLDAFHNMTVGQEFNSNVASWSSDHELATKWAGNAGNGGVVLKCEGGAQGLDLAGHSSMSEWITDGHFQVTAVEHGVNLGTGHYFTGDRGFKMTGTMVTVRQTAVFDAAGLKGTT